MSQPKGIDQLNGKKKEKKRLIYMLSTRDSLQIQGHIQTESEGMEKAIPCKWKSKESWSSNTHIRQIDFKDWQETKKDTT